MTQEHHSLNSLLCQFSENVSDYWVNKSIQRVYCPTPLQFLRDYANLYHPVIITGIIDHWPALDWNMESISECFGDQLVNVNLTPDGKGDIVKNISGIRSFVYPAEVDMTMKTFMNMIQNPSEDDAVPYLSQQDDNLRKHFPYMMKDIEDSLPLAEALVGLSSPEAVNLWIGDQRAVSSLHKDHFENFYAVVVGEKSFILLPPTDIVHLKEIECPALEYILLSSKHGVADKIKQTDLELRSVRKGDAHRSDYVTWIVDDLIELTDQQSVFSSGQPTLTHPIHIHVQAGEVLYLPAMWYHQVSQTCPTIAVNYWYDQRFDFRYVFANLSRQLKSLPFPDHAESQESGVETSDG